MITIFCIFSVIFSYFWGPIRGGGVCIFFRNFPLFSWFRGFWDLYQARRVATLEVEPAKPRDIDHLNCSAPPLSTLQRPKGDGGKGPKNVTTPCNLLQSLPTIYNISWQFSSFSSPFCKRSPEKEFGKKVTEAQKKWPKNNQKRPENGKNDRIPCADLLLRHPDSLFFEHFSLSSRDFPGMVRIKNPLFFWWISLPSSNKNKERKDREFSFPLKWV